MRLVSDQIAVLAHKKGFAHAGHPYLIIKGWETYYLYPKTGNRLREGRTGKVPKDKLIVIPDRDNIVNWLREKKDHHISLQCWNAEWKFDIQIISHCSTIESQEDFKSYDMCLEKAILFCLNNLSNYKYEEFTIVAYDYDIEFLKHP